MTKPGHDKAPTALINIASRALTRLNDRRLRPLGLTFSQMPVLAALSKAEALPQKELVTLARIEQSSMAQLLTRMERDGLVQRTSAPYDRRISLISLTGTGRAKMSQVRSALFETNDRALRNFGDDEVDLLISLLSRLVTNLEEDLADALAEKP